MSENQPQNKSQNSSEEIDLGNLFLVIGNMFKNFFEFLASIFSGLFHLIILFLIFIQKHFLKLLVAGLIGLIVGVFLDNKKGPRFISTMVVEPNFNSAQQLYNNINFYNELAMAGDSVALAEALDTNPNDEVLDITPAEASAFKSFSIESYADENQKIMLFDQFVRNLDTSTQKTINMEKFLENFNSFDARFHTISVVANNSFVAKKSQPAIISSIQRNAYFESQKNISIENLNIQDSIVKMQLTEIDSLQKLYKLVLLKEAEKPLQGTNISLGEGKGSENKEMALIRERNELKENIVELNEERANKSSIINIISDFPRRGVEIKGFTKSYVFMLPVTLIGVCLLLLSLLQLNKFLKSYKN
ncbi:hypothetical protein [Robertkochia solimangrovi]|uniref:hypothetical protein n=1 Tax=Robertkochia solimangrovi TaxID=2213046 RepID=UPI0011807881|nr:hypothetical protein [Robertkochia solimangrovi]TRZ46038.1 hypothetical protein DMZ48_01850 [Robertkochia solimangrovi]